MLVKLFLCFGFTERDTRCWYVSRWLILSQWCQCWHRLPDWHDMCLDAINCRRAMHCWFLLRDHWIEYCDWIVLCWILLSLWIFVIYSESLHAWLRLHFRRRFAKCMFHWHVLQHDRDERCDCMSGWPVLQWFWFNRTDWTMPRRLLLWVWICI